MIRILSKIKQRFLTLLDEIFRNGQNYSLNMRLYYELSIVIADIKLVANQRQELNNGASKNTKLSQFLRVYIK